MTVPVTLFGHRSVFFRLVLFIGTVLEGPGVIAFNWLILCLLRAVTGHTGCGRDRLGVRGNTFCVLMRGLG